MKPKKIKALSLLSGGLDSILATKLIIDQGIDVVSLNFVGPFCTCSKKEGCNAVDTSKKFKIPIKIMPKGMDYIRIVRNPRHGYGSGMNPCIDCRIYMLKKAKKYAKEIGADFIFTGEVLNERPMSQYRKAMEIIEKEAGLKGNLLRPLSAKLLPKTEAEKKGFVNREKLLAIRGRRRTPQMELANKLKLDYPCPAGGCLLTDKEFARKIKDLFDNKKKLSMKDILILKIGRHFRYKDNKIVVGRNQEENKKLIELKQKEDYFFEVPDVGSPTAILQGKKSKTSVELADKLTSRYYDSKEEKIKVLYGKNKPDKKIIVEKLEDKNIGVLRI